MAPETLCPGQLLPGNQSLLISLPPLPRAGPATGSSFHMVPGPYGRGRRGAAQPQLTDVRAHGASNPRGLRNVRAPGSRAFLGNRGIGRSATWAPFATWW